MLWCVKERTKQNTTKKSARIPPIVVQKQKKGQNQTKPRKETTKAKTNKEHKRKQDIRLIAYIMTVDTNDDWKRS